MYGLLAWKPLNGKPGLHMAVWSQVKVPWLQPTWCTPALCDTTAPMQLQLPLAALCTCYAFAFYQSDTFSATCQILSKQLMHVYNATDSVKLLFVVLLTFHRNMGSSAWVHQSPTSTNWPPKPLRLDFRCRSSNVDLCDTNT